MRQTFLHGTIEQQVLESYDRHSRGTMRPSRDQWAMALAVVTAQRSTCLRRHVGCVLLDHRGHVLATGYNGVAAGMPHCNERVETRDPESYPWKILAVEHPHACAGSRAAPGASLDACEAIHAEANALLQCHDVHEIATAYVTASPCIQCTKLLLNTGCERIVYLEPYPHPEAEVLWDRAGRQWEHFKGDFQWLKNL